MDVILLSFFLIIVITVSNQWYVAVSAANYDSKEKGQ